MIRSRQPWNIIPKLLRVALLALVCVIGFKGIQVLIAPPVQVIGEPTKQEIHETRSLVQQLVADSAGEGRAGRGEGCRLGCRSRGQRSGGGRQSLLKPFVIKLHQLALGELEGESTWMSHSPGPSQNARAIGCPPWN
jgi:hypothetical protein